MSDQDTPLISIVVLNWNGCQVLENCLRSLYLVLKVLEIKEMEVVTTPMTFISTNHAVLYI